MRRALWTTCVALFGCIALYSLLGFLLVPHFVDRWLKDMVATEYGRRLDIKSITVNPYTLAVSLRNVTLYGPENLRLVSISDIVAGVDIKSFIEPGWVFRDPVELISVDLGTRAGDTPFFTAARIAGSGVIIDAARESVSIARAEIGSPNLRLNRNRAGHLELPSWLDRLLFDPVGTGTHVGSIELVGGRATISDDSVSPPVRISAARFDASLAWQGTGDTTVTAISAHGQLAGVSTGELAAAWQRSRPDDSSSLHAALRDFDLAVLSPYAAEFWGRGIASGSANLSIDVRRIEDRVDVDARLVADDLRLRERMDSDSTAELSLELALALLEDANGRIRIAGPARLSPADIAFNPAHAYAQAMQGAITRLTSAPFDELARLAGVPGETLNSLEFPPGSAEITAGTAERLTLLATALERRPLLRLIVRPAYDTVADREALARQQVRLHVTLATSAGPPGRANEEPLDFNDPKVRLILDEFAGTRLSDAQRVAMERRQPDKNLAYYRLVFDTLVANQAVAESAMIRLARYRAQSARAELLRLGIATDRLYPADDLDVLTDARDASSVDLNIHLVPARELFAESP